MNFLHPQTRFCNQNNRSNHSIAAIRAELIGSDRCSAIGIVARSTAPVLALCRLLVEAGHDPATPLEAWRGTTLCLRVRSLGEGAALRIGTHGVGFERLPECTAASPMRQNEVGSPQHLLSGAAL
jgi:hypothetical protein